MTPAFGFGAYSDMTEPEPSWPMPQRAEMERLRGKSKQYVLEKYEAPLTTTEATEIPTMSDTTLTLFEYDITGARVRAMGQVTGGFLRDVAENEAAFSYILQDAVGLYLLNKIASSEGTTHLDELEDVIGDSKGWLRFSLLVKGGLVDVVGSEVRATERGLNELSRIVEYCQLQGREDV